MADPSAPEGKGQDVVKASIAKVHALGFADDRDFLLRVAWVESKFGNDGGTYKPGYDGGIWQVDEIGYKDTKDVKSHPSLSGKFTTIKQQLHINWPDTTWKDLRKPLYSAIAARLKLSLIPSSIPSSVEEQAKYWKKYYNTESGAGTVEKFIKDVQQMPK